MIKTFGGNKNDDEPTLVVKEMKDKRINAT